jgi:hypothetical protein
MSFETDVIRARSLAPGAICSRRPRMESLARGHRIETVTQAALQR